MGTALSVLRTRTRLHLQEATSREWEDPNQVDLYIARAYQWFAAWLGQLKSSGWFQYTEDITLAADATTFDLTGLTKTFGAVKFMQFAHQGGGYSKMVPLQEGDDFLLRTTASVVTSNVPPAYQVRKPSTLFFLPQSADARTVSITYRWRPAQMTTDGATVDTPDEYDDVLELRAVIFALADEGEKDAQMEGLLAERLIEVEGFESHANEEGGTQVVKNVSERVLFGQL